jgi:AhpD family alkylhydroperoxidase
MKNTEERAMDEKTSLLICLGASTAANCIPCFEHYHKKASAAGLTPEEILEAVELANKVKSGAHLVMRSSIKTFMGGEAPTTSCGCGPSQKSCCD